MLKPDHIEFLRDAQARLPDTVKKYFSSNRGGRGIIRSCSEFIRMYHLIEADDTILVALSGGKDSWVLLIVLEYLRSQSPVPFRLQPVHVHPGIPGYDPKFECGAISEWLPQIKIVQTHIYQTILDRESQRVNHCAFCARLRRGVLCRVAVELGCNKIALGHHADDAIETILLGMFFEGQLAPMKPIYHMSRMQVTVIRPLLSCWEKDIQKASRSLELPIIPNGCPFPQTASPSRNRIKRLLTDLNTEYPGVKKRLHTSLHELNRLKTETTSDSQ